MAVTNRTEAEKETALKTFDWISGHLLTEENTDTIIEVVKGYIPFGGGWIVGKVLDALLPDTAVDIVREIMQRTGWLDRSDRYLDPDNPFRKAAGD